MEETLIETLIETYNVNKIDTADEALKDALYKEAKIDHMKIYNEQKELVKENERTILKKLIKNHFDPDVVKPMPKFIGGPSTLTVHKSPDEKIMIYNFGEEHTGIKDCSMFEKEKNDDWNDKNPDKMTIDYFLYELMKSTSAYLDIYFEFPAFEKELHGYHPYFQFSRLGNHLTNLFEKFKNCIGASRSKDDCALARVHFFDSRNKDNKGNIIALTDADQFSYKIYDLKGKHKNLDKLTNSYIDFIKNKKVNYILKSLGEESTDEMFAAFWVKQLNNKLITKETKSGKYENRRTNSEEILRMNLLKDLMENEIVKKAMKYRKKIIELVTNIFEESKKGKSINKNIFVDAFYYLAQCITHITVIVADIYLIARLFKNFDMTKIETHGNFITDQPTKAHNVIIYAGNTHSLLYRRFLNEIAGFEEIASTGKDTKHCINMETIPQPFFSTWTKTPTK
jgi:hypothetical protein